MPKSPGSSPGRPLEITVTVHDDRAVLALAGEIDASNSPEIVLHADHCLGQPQIKQLVADLSAVTFLDSSGIRALLFCRGHALGQGKAFHIQGQRGQAAMIIEAVGLTEVFANPAFTADPT